MPRNNNATNETAIDGATALGLEAEVSEVRQNTGNFDGVVFDFTKAPKVLIPHGTEVEVQVKSQRFGYTKNGDPKISFLYAVESGDYEGETFFDDLQFIPARPPKKGTMWRVHQFAESVDTELPTSLAGAEIVPWIKSFGEEMLGERLRVIVKLNPESEYEGKHYEARNSVEKFIPANARNLDDLFS